MTLRKLTPGVPFAFCIVLAFLLVLPTGCGSSGSSNMGGGNPPPPPPPPTNPNANQWAWMGGSNTVGTFGSGPTGVYGTQGQPAASNTPGGRAGAATWKDASGNIWIFGGSGVDSAGNSVLLNDLWEFDSSTKQWTWIDGSETGGTIKYNGLPGVYGTKGVAAAANIPGGRYGAVSWIDPAGNLWLLGARATIHKIITDT